MSVYERCRATSSKSIDLIVPWLEQKGWELTPYITEKDQLTKGDYRGHHLTHGSRNFEMKAEWRYTGNLFVEEWSNLRLKKGWFYNLTLCDDLLYHFLDTGNLYVIKMPALRAFPCTGYRSVRQTKNEQNNDTRGWIVPIEKLKSSGVIIGTAILRVAEVV